MYRSKKGDVFARAAIKEICNHGLDQLFEKVSPCFPRNPRVLAEALDIELVPFDFSKPGSEALYLYDSTWFLGYRRCDSIALQNFAIAHGIVHWVVHRNKQGFDGCRMDWRFEVGANAGAGLLMIPNNELEHIVLFFRFNNIRTITDMVNQRQHLEYAAKHFEITIYVLVWRLVEFGVIRKEIAEIYLNNLYHRSTA